MHLGSNLKIRKRMLEEWSPAMLPHGRHSLFQPPMQLPDQACGHSCAPTFHGVAARNTNLDPTTTHLENFTKSLGAQLRKTRQAWQSRMSPSLSGPGGDPTCKSLGSEPPLLEHFALGEGKATEFELLASHMIQNINEHVKAKACKSKLRKGIKQEDPRGELNNRNFLSNNQLAQTKEQTKEEMQLDQARLHSSQRQLEQEKKQTIGQNNLGTNSLRRRSGFETNNLGTLGHKNIRTNSLGYEKTTMQQELRARDSNSKISNQTLEDLDRHKGRNLCCP